MGIVTIGLALTAVVVALWFAVVRDALVDASPDAVRLRLPARARLDRTAVLLSPVAAVIGAGSHVLWDSFTHPGRWGVRQIGWLERQHGGLTGAEWAQYASSVVGLGVVGLAVLAHLRASAPDDTGRPPRRLPRATLPVVIAVAAVAGAIAAAWKAPQGLHSMAFYSAVVGIGVLVLGLVALSLAWNARRP